MKSYTILLCAALMLTFGCTKDDSTQGGPSKATLDKEAVATMKAIWSSQMANDDAQRISSLNSMQQFADRCSADYFKVYQDCLNEASENMEKFDPILSCYRAAFDRVLDGLKSESVATGNVVVWQLYNMGYVVKTSNGSFGIDISHRWAEKLAPYLDFICITHNHSDHYSKKLIEEMFYLQKPVISNYLKKDEAYQYTSQVAATYEIGAFNIKSTITDHNNSDLKNFVTVFRIDCGAGTDNFTIMHCGDSNFNVSQFGAVGGGAVDLYIPRYSPNDMTENNIIGSGSGQVIPSHLFVSHILEMSHADLSASRWSVTLGLSRAAKLNCAQSYMPIWGDRVLFVNKQMENTQDSSGF